MVYSDAKYKWEEVYMNGRIRIWDLIIAIALMIVIFPVNAHAAVGDVKVEIPKFPVSINGVEVQNSHRQYPFVVYNDITYFPMTYYDCRFLGLETKWDSFSGLGIQKTGITGGYRDYTGTSRNRKSYRAEAANFQVDVNGKIIDNSKEDYPLITFRNVTYFPLTWRFAVEEFGWEYKFEAKNGLEVNSSNKKVERVELEGYEGGSFTMAKGYYYYNDSKGSIMQAPADNPKSFKKVYSLPIWTYGSGETYVYGSLCEYGGDACLSYHQGGAVMGSDYLIRLKPDGTNEDIVSGYLTAKEFGDIGVKVYQGPAMSPGNLEIKVGDGEYSRIGDDSYMYGWITYPEGGINPSGDIYLRGRDLYMLAYKSDDERVDRSSIYSINVDTGRTVSVSDLKTDGFEMNGDSIYCVSEGKLYRIDLYAGVETGIETAVQVKEDSNVKVLGDNIYYVGAQDEKLYRVGNDKPLNPAAKLKGMYIEDGYLICTFEEKSDNPYRIMVFDKNGDIGLKTADVSSIADISIESGKLFYVEDASKNVYSVDLVD